jgi:hypothetical protein
MPRKELNTESKIMACNGAFVSPLGAEIRFTMACKISSMPLPSLALADRMSSRLQPIKFYNFISHHFGVSMWQVNFIHDRNDFQIVLQSQIKVRNSLCFNTLTGINN